MFGRRRLRQLQHENDVLREALGFYAAVRHWQRRGANAKGEPRSWIKPRATVDRGAKARLVLLALQPRAARPMAHRFRGLFRAAPKPAPRPTVPAPRATPLSELAE